MPARFRAFAVALALLAGLTLGVSCSNPTSPAKTTGPVVDTLTANQIAGRYYGQITMDNFVQGTRSVEPGSVTITPTSTPEDGTICACTFSLYLDCNPNSSFTDLLYTDGHPLGLKRECSSDLFYYTFVGNCDGKTVSGIHDQYHLGSDHTVGGHMFTLSFTATRH